MTKAATAHGILESIKQILNNKAVATFLIYPPIIEILYWKELISFDYKMKFKLHPHKHVHETAVT